MMGVDLMPFADNWAYLKTELGWLDRLLMLAIARQRKETKAINRVAKTTADRVSAHWWKGVISVSNPAYDDCRLPASTQNLSQTSPATSPPTLADSPDPVHACKPIGYQQQLDSRIQASAKAQVVLALPSLRHYLNLTLFEKNLILMALAPEVNRRYGRLYHFLQTGEDSATASDLPTVDLALRLLCRNDLERRRARAKLSEPRSLIERQILHYVSPKPSTRLNSYLQLGEPWVNYLLAEQPDQQILFERLANPAKPVLALPAPTAATRAVQILQPQIAWDRLILPAPLLAQLQTLAQQTSLNLLAPPGLLAATAAQPLTPSSADANSQSTTAQPISASPQAQVALLVGLAGTGKTTAAGALATALRQPLCLVDLKQLQPQDWLAVLDSLEATRYPVLLLKSAPVWFGRNSTLPTAQLSQWLQRRQAAAGLTLLSCRYLHSVKAQWRQQMDSVLTLPLPHRTARAMLWQQAFAGIACSPKIDWVWLAKQQQITGGEIQLLAREAVAIAQAKNAKAISFSHIQQAFNQRGRSTAGSS
jgi:hypothetical protein